MSTPAYAPSTPLQIGVLLESVQFSDVASIDLFGGLSKEYLSASASIDERVAALAPLGHDITFHFVSSSERAATMIPGISFNPTTTYAACPRDLDILLIGGPLPDHRPPGAAALMREVRPECVIMSVCTGGLWLASSGMLDGRRATANRGALDLAKRSHPAVNWARERWVVDGRFWTAGAAGCGIDMVVEFLKLKFDARLVELVLEGLHFGSGKGSAYDD